MPFIGSHIIALVSSSRKMLDNSSDIGQACLVPDFSGNFSVVFLLIVMLNYDLGYNVYCIVKIFLYSYFDTVVKNMPLSVYNPLPSYVT